VDARLVMALVAAESAFRPDAVSRCGALGLGQLMPFTAEGFGICDPFSIDENIRGTFAYLDREIARWADYNYPLDRVLAAYNAGPSAVERYTDPPNDGIPPYEETVNYVRIVINYYFYMLPEEERAELLIGRTRHVNQANGIVQLAQ
jgi:soluble lytic murein transglycosylase-like protein